MFLLLCISCLLLASNFHAAEAEYGSVDNDSEKDKEEMIKFWKLIFNTYYNLKGVRNETTDDLVDAFFEHEFSSYPDELYPAFKKIFVHISKSNDRIWNFYESILYMYNNVEAADRVYETVLKRFALGKLFKESGELDLDATFPLVEESDADDVILRYRSGEMHVEEPVYELDESPCGDECGIPPLQVGSIRAIPGVHFPNYDEIPLTSFTCAGKHIPGLYADLETGCQVFHVCYPHRRESFLCPIGTIFNQAILACDYWYSSNCSLAPLYFHPGPLTIDEHFTEESESFVDHLLEQYEKVDTITSETLPHVDYPTKGTGKPKSPKVKITLPNIDWTLMIRFLPTKSKITEYPDVCESTTIAYPTTTSTPEFPDPIVTTPRPVIVTPFPTVATVPPKKDKYDEKTGKPEILLDLLRAIEVLTKDAEGFLTKMVQKKRKHEVPQRKPTPATKFPIEKPKPFPEINPRFVVKPGKVERHLTRPTVSPSKTLKPSRKILKSKKQDPSRKKETAKFVIEGMKALEHLFG